MIPFLKTDALVLREAKYKEADRILTLFTRENGIITAKARGALRKNSKIGAATQQFTFSEMTLFMNKGYFTVNEAEIKEPFDGLRTNFENYSLACYFAECTEAMVPEETPDADALQLVLNCLYALSHEMHEPEKIKSAFEMRLMAIMGYTPYLENCCICGKPEPEEPMLGLEEGQICCRMCRDASIRRADRLCNESLAALKYIVSAPAKQLLSFQLDAAAQKRLSLAGEDYVQAHAERSFGTLDYWKRIVRR